MAKFTNLNSTAAVLDAGFTFAEHNAEMDTVLSAIDGAATTIASSDPITPDGVFPAAWADGTRLDVGSFTAGSNSLTLNDAEIIAPDGAHFDMRGTARITVNLSTFEISSARASLSSLMFGNDQASQIINGAVKLDLVSGTASGKLTSLTFAWFADNPATPGVLEWQYVMLRGSGTVSGDAFSSDFGVPSGRISGFEWGTMTADANGHPLGFTPTTSFSGLRMDAASTLNGLDAGGFNSLMAGLYAGSDVIDGTAGDDFLDASTGNDKVFGEEGDDHIDGGAGNDQLFGGAGNDHVVGGAGNDRIVDESGDNTVIDTEGNARVTTGGGNDDITTGAGNDRIVAGDGDNDVDAGAGNDNIATGAGADFILAGSGNDKVVAGDGANWVEGGAGNDVLRTGTGADVIYGGEGADKINGGAGSDVFAFDNLAVGGKDLINDFNAAEDFFAFDTDVFTSLAGGITSENFIAGKVALETDDFLIFDSQGGKLYYDADGSNAGAAVQIAVVKGSVTDLVSGNFIDEATLFV